MVAMSFSLMKYFKPQMYNHHTPKATLELQLDYACRAILTSLYMLQTFAQNAPENFSTLIIIDPGLRGVTGTPVCPDLDVTVHVVVRIELNGLVLPALRGTLLWAQYHRAVLHGRKPVIALHHKHEKSVRP